VSVPALLAQRYLFATVGTLPRLLIPRGYPWYHYSTSFARIGKSIVCCREEKAHAREPGSRRSPARSRAVLSCLPTRRAALGRSNFPKNFHPSTITNSRHPSSANEPPRRRRGRWRDDAMTTTDERKVKRGASRPRRFAARSRAGFVIAIG